MHCTYCNFQNKSENKFCESCGKPLQGTDLSSVAPKIAGVKAGKTGFSRNWLLFLVLVVILLVGGYALWNYIEEVQSGTVGDESSGSPKPPPSIKFIPLESTKSNSSEPGWQRLEVETAIANMYPEFRLYVLDCAGVREISATSAESRKESVNWWFDSSCTILTLPPGMILRNPSNIYGELPRNMTSIEFAIPYSDLPMSNLPWGAVESNSTARINLATDYVVPSSIDFPVYDESLLDVYELGEVFDLEAAKVQVGTSAQIQDDVIVANIRLHNTDSLDSSQFDHIMIYGAGSDGVVRYAEELRGHCPTPLVGSHRLNFVLGKIGPGQTTNCKVQFTKIPNNINNFHVWFTLYQGNEPIIDSGTFRVDEPPQPAETSGESNVAVLPSTTSTKTPVPPTSTIENTPESTIEPTITPDATATLDRGLLPPDPALSTDTFGLDGFTLPGIETVPLGV